MPANKKYLSSTPQRILKISAGAIGGYLVTLSMHLCLLYFFPKRAVLMTSMYYLFTVWAALLLIAFLFHNGWKAWLYYILLSLLFLLPVFIFSEF